MCTGYSFHDWPAKDDKGSLMSTWLKTEQPNLMFLKLPGPLVLSCGLHISLSCFLGCCSQAPRGRQRGWGGGSSLYLKGFTRSTPPHYLHFWPSAFVCFVASAPAIPGRLGLSRPVAMRGTVSAPWGPVRPPRQGPQPDEGTEAMQRPHPPHTGLLPGDPCLSSSLAPQPPPQARCPALHNQNFLKHNIERNGAAAYVEKSDCFLRYVFWVYDITLWMRTETFERYYFNLSLCLYFCPLHIHFPP